MPRVAAIGLDAAERALIERLIRRGQLPNIAALGRRGATARLHNVVAYRSELPWTQFLTGRTAPANQYWSTVQFESADYRTYCIGAHSAKPFYALGDDAKVIAFDLPHSVIREDVNGVQVTAWGAHSAQYPRASRPAGLLREIEERFGPHPAFDNDYDGGWHQPRFLDALGEALLIGARRRIDIALWLMERFSDWDLFVTVLSESHSGGHHFWHGIDPDHPLHEAATSAQAERWLLRVYRTLDEGVGRILAALDDETTVVVFSVHGMQTNHNDVPSLALLPELAHRLHFGERLLADASPERWRRAGCPPIAPRERLTWSHHVGRQWAATPAARRRRALRRVAPQPVIDAARSLQRRVTGHPRLAWDLNTEFPPECDLAPEEMAGQRASLHWQMPHRYRPWWPRMRWFVLPTFSDAHVRINLQGRERDGVVARDDYERVCDEVEATLRRCTDARTGRAAVDEVIRLRRDAPLDPHGADADLVVLWASAVDALEHPDVGTIGPLPFNRTGEHSANGFAVVAGPGIEAADLGERSAFDITPTLVALLDRRPDPGFDGTPLVARAPTG